ncbi:hypothetical protein BGZ95_011312 [Linnemannia exigua]|uniref:Uncharacterized protein n=1 Tax=Linnemannia exigua TaxID=604196 RepID=A0AAD4H988_9FUNG|nr:hypothetical protein BGZ95_011312 [Linnemannia exigua]
MVTTRSRGNKQAAGLDTAQDVITTAAAPNTAIPTSTDTHTTTSPLKRKSGTGPADALPATKIAKTDLDPELDMNSEPVMPPAPAPTPITPANTAKQQQQQNQPPPLQQQLPTAVNVSQPTLDDIIAAAAVGTGFALPTAPSSNGTGGAASSLATATAPPAPEPAVEESLVAMKEPEPESAPLPELSTVLTEPAAAHQQPIIPPAPTAPALSTIAAPAPVSANTATTATATGHGNGVVPLDAFSINSKTNAIPPGDLTPIPSASPLPAAGLQQVNSNTNNNLKGEAALTSNIGINTADNGGGMAPTAPVVAPAGNVDQNHQQQQSGSNDGVKPTVVPVQPLSSVI